MQVIFRKFIVYLPGFRLCIVLFTDVSDLFFGGRSGTLSGVTYSVSVTVFRFSSFSYSGSVQAAIQ